MEDPTEKPYLIFIRTFTPQMMIFGYNDIDRFKKRVGELEERYPKSEVSKGLGKNGKDGYALIELYFNSVEELIVDIGMATYRLTKPLHETYPRYECYS